MSQPQLTLEILSGPLDGHTVDLAEETRWGKQSQGPLGFPWDSELGDPQARFFPDQDGWWIEALAAPHGTYRISGNERISGTVRLEPGDVLKASDTWLEVKRAELRK